MDEYLEEYIEDFSDSFSEPAFEPRIDFKKELNEQQYAAVTAPDGPSLVLAGAGSGKTRVLTYRLAWLVERGISPAGLLLVTFTNKAAREMLERAEKLLAMQLSGLWMGTFHHIGNKILRREARHIGYSPDFSIIDRDDSCAVIGEAMEDLNLKTQAKFLPQKEIMLNIHSLAVNALTSVDDIIISRYPHLEEFALAINRIINRYQEKKRETAVMDFDDLLLYWLKVLEIEEIQQRYAGQFSHILVDEYQDTNRLQFEILKKLTVVHNNIMAVGDDAQSIYSFRAAEIKNILEFERHYPGTQVFKLEANYRSSPEIIELANSSILNNTGQYQKQLQAMRANERKPALVKSADVYKQADFIVNRVLDLKNRGVSLHNVAVLMRSRFQSMELELELMKQHIPYVVRGGRRFFEQAHIKDVLSYLKIALNPQDELSFKRVLCLHNGIGKKGAQKIWEMMTKEQLPHDQVYKKLPAKQKEGFKAFYPAYIQIKDAASPEEAVRAAVEAYTPYIYLTFENYDERLQDLEELSRMAHTYDSLRKFVDDLGLYEGFEHENRATHHEPEDVLVVSTIHQAKGLEWDAVFLIGLTDQDFPHPKSLNSHSAVEEERRLFYVAVTRSRKILYMVYPELRYSRYQGTLYCRPSLFIQELPGDLYDTLSVR